MTNNEPSWMKAAKELRRLIPPAFKKKKVARKKKKVTKRVADSKT